MTANDVNSQREALQDLILDSALERLEDLLADFNLFDVLGIARAEVQHSAFLAWLLDPRGSQAFGTTSCGLSCRRPQERRATVE